MSRRLSVLLLAGLVLPPLPVPAAARAAAPKCGCATTHARAQAMAKACQGRVEDLSARTEYSQTFTEVPQRARRADGAWSAIDTTVRRVPSAAMPP